MKTLPEILTKHITDFNIRDSGGMNDTKNVKLCNLEAIEAIAKELMGCLPEKIKYTGDEIMGIRIAVSEEAGHKLEFRMPKEIDAYNKALDEVRARLTAFIGKGEK